MIGFEMAGCFQHFIIQVDTLQPIPLERHETAHVKNDAPMDLGILSVQIILL